MDDVELSGHVRAAQVTLEHIVQEQTEFAPMVIVYRAGRLVAQAIIEAPQGGISINHTARIAAAAFGADELLLISDSYQFTGEVGKLPPLNPITGKEWQHGDMERIVREHDGLARGIVTECLILFLAGRGRPDHMVCLPYTRHDDGSVTWTEEKDLLDGRDGDEHIPGGRFTDMFENITPDLRLPDPIAAMALQRFGATVALAFYDDETDPMMLSLRDDVESGRAEDVVKVKIQ